MSLPKALFIVMLKTLAALACAIAIQVMVLTLFPDFTYAKTSWFVFWPIYIILLFASRYVPPRIDPAFRKES